MSSKTLFLDQAKIFIKAGNGGDGVATFFRAKYIPNGGPDGGDGGRGGDIWLRGSVHKSSLQDFRKKRHFRAENGQPGRKREKTGASGNDIIIDVPLGTVATETESNKIIGEIMEDGQTLLLQKGGKGGLGNVHFKSSINQAPTKALPGQKTQEQWVQLELRILSDIGLVGFPNAGKSTFLTQVSNSKSKVGNYAFTTLHPHLGVVSTQNGPITIADIPGIIEGASQGQGLGLDFLRHIHRTRALLFMLESCPQNLEYSLHQYETLCKEIEHYNPEILKKNSLIVLTKIDLLTKNEIEEANVLFQKIGKKPFFISSKENIGIKDLLNALPTIL